jgi:hypothetical protein
MEFVCFVDDKLLISRENVCFIEFVISLLFVAISM